ncbi:MAG: methyltransferase domain-containing protein [candidate division Zixibacteria bacterium]|nr:methyltransferase domain-containing protein [candidate division Zixibacteria bacterium]
MTATRQQTSVADYFDREAERFPLIGAKDRGMISRMVDRLFRRSIRLRFERVMELCRPIEGRTVLDIGCGTGTYAIRLAQRGASHVLGIDPAPRMIELARERAEARGVAPQCTFEVTSLKDLTIEKPFDYIVVMGVLDYISDAAPFVQKAIQATGIRACFSLPRYEGLLAWQRRLRYRNRCPLYMYRESDVTDLFAATGASYQIERLARDWFVSVEYSTGATT